MEINKEHSKFILQKFAKFLNSIFPGVIILELFFKKGLFSIFPDSIYTFILYIFWAIIFSIPFSFFNHEILGNFMKFTFKLYGEKNNFTKEEITQIYDNLSDDDKEFFDDSDEEILFGMILFKTLLVYLLFKLNAYYQIIDFTLLNISTKYLSLISIIILVQIISYPIGYLFAKVNLFRFAKYFEKDDF